MSVALTPIAPLREAFARGLTPPPELTITQWADAHRVLPSNSSSEAGQWRTSRFPWTAEIMDCMSPQSPVQEVVWMAGAQVAKTEAGLNTIGYTFAHQPAPILYVLPTIETAEKFSTQRLSPSIEACPAMAAKVVDTRHKFRDADSNTKRMKSFPGGILLLAGANSAASLRMMPIQVLILDEIDGYVSDLQGEGDPVQLAVARTRNFPRRKILYLSTPAVKETSRIEPLFDSGDQRYFHVPCPHCGNFAPIWWSDIEYTETEDGQVADVWLNCRACKGKIPERYKTQMLAAGHWVPTHPGRRIASFHLSSLYSPLGFFSWTDAATMWLQAQKNFDKEKLKVFVNTVLGETWTTDGKSIEAGTLASRRETYAAEVPAGALVLTAGVDVQEDRIEVEVLGSGKNNETWSIDYAVFMGDTEGAFVWQQLDQYLARMWRHESGVDLNLACVAIDSGHRAKVVYNFCRANKGRRHFAIKGREGWGMGYIRKPTKENEEGVWLFLAYVDELKSKVLSDLKVENAGPGYSHFPDKPVYDSAYFRMLTAETLVTKRVEGRNRLKWHLGKGRRNEALDCRCYAIAALHILNPTWSVIEKPIIFRDRTAPGARHTRRVHSQGIA